MIKSSGNTFSSLRDLDICSVISWGKSTLRGRVRKRRLRYIPPCGSICIPAGSITTKQEFKIRQRTRRTDESIDEANAWHDLRVVKFDIQDVKSTVAIMHWQVFGMSRSVWEAKQVPSIPFS